MSRLLPHYSKGKTAFLCVDLQTAFTKHFELFQNYVFVANRFARASEALPEHTKYIATEQYPKGLGHLVPDIKLPPSALVFEKTRFSCLVPPVVEALSDVDNVVIFGIEGHVCVLQTTAELLDMKKRVFLSMDGVGSQKKTDLKYARKLMSTWGPDCVLTTSESILLQMAKDAKDPNFKKFSAMLKETYPIAI